MSGIPVLQHILVQNDPPGGPRHKNTKLSTNQRASKNVAGMKKVSGTFRHRILIIAVGLVIGLGSIIATNRMARQLRDKERNEVALWSYAMSKLGETDQDHPLLLNIISSSNNIPFIVTDENLRVESAHLIPQRILSHPGLLRRKLEKMSAYQPPLEVVTWSNDKYYIFYDESRLLKNLVYFPYIQLLVIILFVTFAYIAFRSSKQDEQNRVWIGLAKETAHQLGTPTSSLLGWIEYLRTQPVDQTAVQEMNNDLVRLMKVVDRFSKIGSATELKEGVVNEIVGGCVLYFRTRIPKKVTLQYNGLAIAPMKAMVNEALFEWVIENLLKNALDAMQGEGRITVTLSDDGDWIYIDVKDTGKGISKNNVKRIFEPGFTTKTRGWGLGLSLSRRIIEGYHDGKIFVLESEPDRGTTIRVAIKKLYS